MPQKKDKLVIVGAGEPAEMAYFYFTRWSQYKVVAFSVEKDYIVKDRLLNLPVVPFENLEKLYTPEEHSVSVGITNTQLNRLRTRFYKKAKEKGFSLASFIHPTTFVDDKAQIGEHCFFYEMNTIQYNVKIGCNVVLWSKNHIGHSVVIKDNCFVSSGATIAGYSEIGENCFLGINSTIIEKRKIAKDCIIGAGAVVLKDTEPGKVYVGNPARPLEKSSYETSKITED